MMILGAILIAGLVVVLLAAKQDKKTAGSVSTQATPPAVAAHRSQTAPAPVTTSPSHHPSGSSKPLPAPRRPPKAQPAPVRPTQVSLALAATDSVWVCLEDQRARRLINGRMLAAGETSGVYHASTAFRLFVGNSAIRLLINGRGQPVPANSNPGAYRVSAHGLTSLPAGTQPPCA